MAVLGLLVAAALGGARPTQAQVTSFNAYLAPGFNNVAYLGPTQPVEAAIAPIAGSVSRVYAWDADIQAYQFYDASFPFSTLTQLEPGQSLWIYVTNSAGVSWSQAVGAMSSSAPLRADFNLVTWTGSDGTPVTEAFGNLALERAWVYNTDIGRYDSYTPGALSFLNRLTTLDFGDGVWLLLPFGQTWQIGGGGEAASVEAITEDYAVSARTGAAAQDAFLDFASQFAQATSGVRDPSEIERLVGEAQARAIIANPSAAANLATTDAVLDGFITTFDASGVSSAQSGTPGVSVRFVNGVLNSAEAAAGGAQSLSGILGVPVTLSYNHSLLETSGYGVSACYEALIKDYPYYQEADPRTAPSEADGVLARAEAWADWIAGRISSAVGTVIHSGLSAACAGIDFGLTTGNITFQKAWEGLYNNAQLAFQRTTNFDFASSSVNTQLVAAIKNEIACGKGVVLMGHSQGTLFSQNAFQQVKTWWETEGRQLLNSTSEVPLGVLYISPAFSVQGNNAGNSEQRYVLLRLDALSEFYVTFSPPTAEPTETQNRFWYLPFGPRALYLHQMGVYLEPHSASRGQLEGAYNDLRALVQARAARGSWPAGARRRR